MPKLLRIVNRFNLGGPTYNAAYLSRFLPEEYDTLLIGGFHEEGEESSTFILDGLGVQYEQLHELKRSINLNSDYAAYQKIVKTIKEFKPDIIHTHASKAGAIGRLAAAKCGIPIVIHTFHGHVFHSYFGKLKTSFYKNLERFLARKSSKIIAISKQQAHELSAIYRICPASKIQIIPLGFELERFNTDLDNKRTIFREKYNLPESTVAIGIIGRLAPIKNHRLFLESFSVLKAKSQKKIVAFIIGDGETRSEIIDYCKDFKLTYSLNDFKSTDVDVIFCGWIKDISTALPGLDIVALSSLNEGTPVSLIEAQSAGKAVVSTNVGGVRDIMLNNISGFVSSSMEASEFSNHLLQLVENESLRLEFGQKGQEFAFSHFHFSRMVNDHHRLYQELLNRS